MKQIWILAVLLFAVACNKNSNNGSSNAFIGDKGGEPLLLSINLAEVPEGNVELHRFDGAERVFVDSFKMEAPQFERDVLVNQPTYYTLSFPDGNVVSFVLNDSPVNITISPEGEPSIEGGLDNELHQEFQTLNEEINAEAQALRGPVMQAQTPEQRSEAEQNYIAFVERAKSRITSFIDKAKGSIVVVSAVSMLDPDEDMDILQEVAASLTKKYPDAKIAKTFAEQVASLSALSVGSIAPDFSLQTAEGEAIKLSSLRGQYVMIDFWASWCGPCRKENPFVKEVYQDFADKGFQILGVSVDRDAAAWQQAIEKDGLPWLHVLDKESTVAETYNVTGIPFTVLLDKEGKILAKGLRSERLKKELEKLL